MDEKDLKFFWSFHLNTSNAPHLTASIECSAV